MSYNCMAIVCLEGNEGSNSKSGKIFENLCYIDVTLGKNLWIFIKFFFFFFLLFYKNVINMYLWFFFIYENIYCFNTSFMLKQKNKMFYFHIIFLYSMICHLILYLYMVVMLSTPGKIRKKYVKYVVDLENSSVKYNIVLESFKKNYNISAVRLKYFEIKKI